MQPLQSSSENGRERADLYLRSPVEGTSFQKLKAITVLFSGMALAACGAKSELRVDEISTIETGGTAGQGGVGGVAGVGGGPGEGGHAGVGGTGGTGGFSDELFNIYYLGNEGPTAVVGEDGVRCLNLELENGLPYDVDIRDWNISIEELLEVSDAGGLFDSTSPVPAEWTTNFHLIKLAKLDDNGQPSSTLLGPDELLNDGLGNDEYQTLTLDGVSTVPSGSKVKAAVVLDVAANKNIVWDKIRCALKNVNGGGYLLKAGTSEPVPQQNVNLPSGTDVAGNIIEIIGQPCIAVSTSANPVAQSVPVGSQNVNFGCWNVVNGCTSDVTLNFLSLHRYGAGSVDDFNGLRLYDGATPISGFQNLDGVDETVNFNNLNYVLNQGVTKTICIHSDVSASAGAGNHDGFEIVQPTDILAHDMVFDLPVSGTGSFPAQGPLMLIANQ